MKICNSPPRTGCMYQRIARDEAPLDVGASADAYEDLMKFLADNLDPSVLSQAEALFRHFLDKSGDGLPYAADGAMIRRARAEVALVQYGRKQARDQAFAKRFPGASRIRSI
jgi:hypothetical protein